MKKIIAILILVVFMTSCYDDFRIDYEYTTVAFSNADGGSNMDGVLYRTAVMGEGMRIDVGIYIAGVIENNQERLIDFEIDESLLAGTGFEMMPNEYYSLSSEGQFIIPKGSHIGKITVELDSARFADDPLAVGPHYAIPFVLTGTDNADSILATNASKIVVMKYINEMTGFYDQEVTYRTTDPDGTELSNSELSNVIEFKTTGPRDLISDGMIFKGPSYQIGIMIAADNTASVEYVPNPNIDTSPKNIAREDPAVVVSTSQVSDWETLEAVNTGEGAPSSVPGESDGGQYGNWPANGEYHWVEYDFGLAAYNMTTSRIFWVSDGGGLLAPNDSYLEYWDQETETWVRIDEPVGLALDQFNETSFDVTTTKIRIWFKSDDSVGISEWEVIGTPVPTEPEQAIIESVTAGTSTFDPETGTLDLSYTINYEFQDYSTEVNSRLVWRNRIRDGVNEWRKYGNE